MGRFGVFFFREFGYEKVNDDCGGVVSYRSDLGNLVMVLENFCGDDCVGCGVIFDVNGIRVRGGEIFRGVNYVIVDGVSE